MTKIETLLDCLPESPFKEQLNAEVDTIRAEVERLKANLETERLRLAACGVAALGYFDGCKDEYRSASLEDTLRLHEKVTELTRQRDEAIALLPRSVPNGFISFGKYYAENRDLFVRKHEAMSKFRIQYLITCEAAIKESQS